ncbi:MAG: serine acetyltransferase, partial [Erysipelotrichaceae bacterium]|nr:serine acetyltransferase [Erysipelotrichaceae bacterium]
MNEQIKKELKDIEKEIIEASSNPSISDRSEWNLPNKFMVNQIVKEIEKMMFPDFFGYDWNLTDIYLHLKQEIQAAWCFANRCDCNRDSSEQLTMDFLHQIPTIQKLLWKDLDAFYEGDPAAKSKEEVVMSYPGFHAVFVHRLAHALYDMNVPMIPRIMSEEVHSQTGIDINPGAQIGEYFFI